MSKILEKFIEDYKDYGKEEKTPFLETPLNDNINVLDKEEITQEVTKEKTTTTQPVKKVVENFEGLKTKTPKSGRLKSPRGIGLLITVILFIVIAVKPTQNGKTRLQLFFISLLGSTKLENVESRAMQYTREQAEAHIQEEFLNNNPYGKEYPYGREYAVQGAFS